MKKIQILTIVLFVSISSILAQSNYYTFHPLPYAFNALEPYIDSTTMQIHYDKHHFGYFKKFTKAIDKNKITAIPMAEIFAKVSKYPKSIRNFGGGYWNHEFFWESMTAERNTKPSEELMNAIVRDFGSYNKFVEEFSKQAKSFFGSGWIWLIVNKQNKLQIVATPNQDNPLMDIVIVKGKPILNLDVWEHAYYLKYQNKRADYVKNFWNVVNWPKVSERYKEALK